MSLIHPREFLSLAFPTHFGVLKINKLYISPSSDIKHLENWRRINPLALDLLHKACCLLLLSYFLLCWKFLCRNFSSSHVCDDFLPFIPAALKVI